MDIQKLTIEEHVFISDGTYNVVLVNKEKDYVIEQKTELDYDEKVRYVEQLRKSYRKGNMADKGYQYVENLVYIAYDENDFKIGVTRNLNLNNEKGEKPNTKTITAVEKEQEQMMLRLRRNVALLKRREVEYEIVESNRGKGVEVITGDISLIFLPRYIKVNHEGGELLELEYTGDMHDFDVLKTIYRRVVEVNEDMNMPLITNAVSIYTYSNNLRNKISMEELTKEDILELESI